MSTSSRPILRDENSLADYHGSSGANLIMLERDHQLLDLGYSPEHDDQHTSSELAAAACCHALCAISDDVEGGIVVPGLWPFDPAQMPDSLLGRTEGEAKIVDALIVAGALIAAEIDRRIRRDERLSTGDSGHE